MSPIKNLNQNRTLPASIQNQFSTNALAKQQKTGTSSPIQSQNQRPDTAAILTKGESTQRLQAIIENSKSSIGAIKQLLSSSIEQAKTDKQAGKGVVAGTNDFTQIISDIQGLLGTHAKKMGYSKSQQTSMNADQLGAIASSFTREGIRTSLIEGAASSLGVNPEALADQGLFDLTRYNLDLFTSSEASALQGIQTAGTGISAGVKGASSTSAGAATSGATGLSAQILGGIGAAYSSYQLIANWGKSEPVSGAINGFTTGAYIGAMVGGGFGAAVGGTIGGLVGLASGFFKKSGKSEEQLARDQVRDFLLSNGSISKDWKLTLADGSGYDIGKDGGHMLQNVDGTERHAYEIDFKHPLAGEVVGMLQPIVTLMTGGNPRLTSDFIGYFTNAALSNAQDPEGARQNALAIYKSLRISPQQVVKGIGALVEKGIITKETGMAYLNGFSTLLAGAKQTAAQSPLETPSASEVVTSD